MLLWIKIADFFAEGGKAVLFATAEQAYIFMGSVYSGLIMGLIYDGFSWGRRTFRAGMILTAILDLAYWGVAFGIIMLTLIKTTGGEIRLYMVVGTFCGICVYRGILSAVVSMLFSMAYKLLRRLAVCILKIPVISRILR